MYDVHTLFCGCLGSDDAHGPVLPPSVLGSRTDSSSSSDGIYHKKKTAGDEILATINEHPSVVTIYFDIKIWKPCSKFKLN